jgi:hypothetical protein
MFIVIRTFRLKDGVRDEDFIAADDLVQTEFVYHQPGLVRRTTARGDAGEWLVVSIWHSATDAADADEFSRDEAASRAVNAMVDGSSVTIKRFETLD